MQSQQIETIENNQDKYNTYKTFCAKLKKAKKAQCYLECLWILYSMIEDRTSAFLYYSGFTTTESRTKVVSKNKSSIRKILEMDEETKGYKFKNLSNKLAYIQKMIEWSKENEGETLYEITLSKTLVKLSTDENFMYSLQYLNSEWREIRNQLMHALFKKKSESVEKELLKMVESGEESIKYFKNATERLKRKEIRKQFKIQ